MKSETIGMGTTNDHWYRLGFNKAISTPWISQHDVTHHGETLVTGKAVSNFSDIWKLCVESHLKLLPDVPMAGWDVALTNKGRFLLEVNLSCNFFRGTFDKDVYFSVVDRYMEELDVIKISTER